MCGFMCVADANIDMDMFERAFATLQVRGPDTTLIM